MRLIELDPAPDAPFPPVEQALRQPEGLLAWGGDLSPRRLLNAYAHGCFPWYERGQPILWWSPNPRLVLDTEGFHVSRRFARFLRHCDWTLSADCRFPSVIQACAAIVRKGQHGTWLVPEMIDAYAHLHALGHAHCVEVSDRQGRLIGGVYGVALGRMFFGESMFSTVSNGSKTALLALCRFLSEQDMPLLDCQMDTEHLRTLGARVVSRERFLHASRHLVAQPGPSGSWRTRFGKRPAAGLISAKLRPN